MSRKYYAVRKGKTPGIYTTWPEAQKEVSGFPNAEFKSFTSKSEAEEFMNWTKIESTVSDEDTVTAYVDGSYDKYTKRYSYGAILLKGEKVLAELSSAGSDPKYVDSFQIAGECFGSLNAIKWARDNGYKRVIVHFDYMGIEKWATKQWRANKAVSKDYVKFFEQLAKDIEVDFVKVKAHAGIEMNERVDQLAKQALK